ncbi:hypothetical protein ACI0FS_01605 [Ochrobactrum quorumnocens]|nr:hypothetical protein [[Ochrobactrum] quorumnocens]
MIRFLIKSVIWLSLAFMVMPHFFPADEETPPQKAPVQAKGEPDSVDQLLANGKTALEIGKLCVNNPSFCENGTSILSNAASGMLERSGGILEYLSDRFGAKQQAPLPDEPIIAKNELPAEPTQSPSHVVPIPTPRSVALRTLKAVPAKIESSEPL